VSADEPGTRFAGGAHVWTERHGRWWSSVVLRAHRDGGYRVRYDDWGPSADEDVPAARVASGSRRPPGRRGSLALELCAAIAAVATMVALGLGVAIFRDDAARPTLTAPPSDAAPSRDRLPREQAVWVEHDGAWCPAVVLAVPSEDVVLVHPLRHASGEDAWVTLDRVRLR
jgi:hypothetical protein